MALPKGLVGEANAHVSQALQTGARGQTTTVTDYGVIGDAFFKKAQMDLQIADLQADMGYKKASLLSGLEMQRADLELKKGSLQLNAAQMAEEQRRYEKAQEVSDSEQLLGSISGAVSGAVTGFTVGGPMGAVIGAGAGGLMTYASYESGGRQAGQQAQQTLGVISQGATTLKGLHDQSVAKDAWQGIMKTGGDLIAQYNSAQTPEQQYAAQQGLDAHIGEVYQTAMSMPGANPEKVGTMVANYRKGLEASVGLPTNEGMKQNHFRQMENMVQYQQDSRKDDPRQQRAWANDFIRDSSAIYEESTGKQMPMSLGMRYAKQMSGQAGRVLEQQMSGGSGSFGSMPTPSNPGQRSIAAPSANQSTQAPVQTQSGTPVEAPTPEMSAPVPFSNGGTPWRPMRPSGPGIEMDDMGGFEPVQAEQELAKQGGETVQKMGMWDKIKHNMSLEEGEDFENNRIPLWEDRDQTVGDKKDGKKVKSQEEFKIANRELDAKLNSVQASPEGARAKSATKTIDRMISLVESGDFPEDSQLKAAGASVYNEGVDVGGMIGTAGGALIGKNAAGAATGAFIGSQMDINVGKGMGPFLSEDEEFAVSEMEKYKSAATLKFAKINDPGSRAVSDADARRFENLWPRPGQTREQQLYSLLTIKEMMLDEVETGRNAEAADRAEKMDAFREKELFKTEQQSIRARNKKAIQGNGNRRQRYVNDFFPL